MNRIKAIPGTLSTFLKDHPWLPAVGILLLAFALYVFNIEFFHMRPDEELSYRNTRHDFLKMIDWLGWLNNQPPLWWSNFWAWWRLVGTSEFAGRVNSILFSMLTLAVLYRVGRRWFGANQYGLFIMAVLATNSVFFIYTLEMRSYAFGMLSVALSFWTFQRWLTLQSWRWAAAFGASMALMLYIHYYLVFLILFQAVFFLAFQRPDWRLIKQGLFAGVFALLLWSPWIPEFINQIQTVQHEASLDPDQDIPSPTLPTDDDTIEDLIWISTNNVPRLYQIALVIGCLLLWRRRWFWLVMLYTIGMPTLLFIINTEVQILTYRYMSFLVVALAIATGAAIATIPTKAKWLVLVAFVAISVPKLPEFIPERTPYRDLYGELSRLGHEDDVLYFDEMNLGAFAQWQINHYIAPEMRDEIVTEYEVAQTAERLWFIADRWGEERNPDLMRRFEALQETHRIETVLGDCNTSWCLLIHYLRQPPLDEPIPFEGEDTLLYRGADVTISEEAVDVRIWWVQDEPVSRDYSITLFVAGSDFVPVAQVDGSIQDFEWGEIPTSQMQTGEIYADQRHLPLPEDLPPGDYEVWLVVYQWWDDTRARLPNGGDYLALATFSLPPTE